MIDISNDAYLARMAIVEAANLASRPSVLYRPTLMADGDMWCALLGPNLQEGIAGFGETPEKAMLAFDTAWSTERTPTARRLARIADEEAREDAAANGQFGVGA